MNLLTPHWPIRLRQRGTIMRRDTFGRRLRLLRDDLRMSQTELRNQMARLGVEIGSSYVSELERTDKMPSLEVAAAMARVLHTTTDYLALLSDEAAPLPPAVEYLSPEADEVARIVDSLPAAARGELLAIARRLALPQEGSGQRASDIAWVLSRVEQMAGMEMRRSLERILLRDDAASAND